MKRVLKAWIFGLGLSLVWVPSVMAGTHGYPELAEQLAQDSIKVLIKHGVCKNPNNDCVHQERIKRGGTPDHAILFVFKVHELKQSTIEDLLSLSYRSYMKTNSRVTVEVKMYRETREKKVALFSGAEPVIHLIFKGDE